MPGKDVFLSYASADRDRIRPLVSVLEDSGWTVFWDRTIPAGKTWREVVGKELENCRSVVVAWSQTSIKSDWVLEEAERGRRSGILVPVRIDDVDPPLGFGAIQAADLFDWNGQSSAPQSQRFVRDLSMVLGEPPITKAAVERRHDEAAAAGPRPAEVRVAEKARQELQERERLQAERSTGPFYEEPQSVSSRRLRRMTITLAAVGLVIIASALYWAYGPMQPKSSFGPDESRVELLLRVNTADEQVVESVEHTIRERLGGLRLRKWSLSREDAPSAQLRLLVPQEVDVDRVKTVIQSSDLLELKLVEQGPSPSKEALLQASAGQVPQHLEVLPGIEEARDGNPSVTVYYLLQKTPVITGRDLRNPRPSLDENNRPALVFSLNQEGAQKLGKATGENVGRQLAIVLNGQVRSAPRIEARITDEAQIAGSFTQQEIQDLVLVLRSAALAAPVTLVERRFVEGQPGR